MIPSTFSFSKCQFKNQLSHQIKHSELFKKLGRRNRHRVEIQPCSESDQELIPSTITPQRYGCYLEQLHFPLRNLEVWLFHISKRNIEIHTHTQFSILKRYHVMILLSLYNQLPIYRIFKSYKTAVIRKC